MENLTRPVKYTEPVEQNLERTNDNLYNGNSFVKTESNESITSHGNIQQTKEIMNPSSFMISDHGKEVVRTILEQINSLPHLEKFLIYLKLNEDVSNIGDPLKQPLNPLGSRSEIHRTISWIKTHLEEDPETSLPKQEVYDKYSTYCSQIRIKPLSQADYGKVMKQVYPKVKARRLGTRGNSRYCYSGLRNCIKLSTPQLPDVTETSLIIGTFNKQSTLESAAWLIVKKWSEDLLCAQFSTIQALAFFLVLNCSVGVGTEAANQITSASESCVKDDDNEVIVKSTNIHREMQMQLQRKIHQKNEVSKERKRKIQSTKSVDSKSSGGKKLKSSSLPRCETSPIENNTSSSTSPIQCKPICDKPQEFTNAASSSDFNCFQKPVPIDENSRNESTPVKVAIPRLNTVKQQDVTSSKSIGAKYKAIQPKLPQSCDIAMYNPLVADNRSQILHQDRIKESDSDEFDTELPLSRERLNSISNVDKDAMDDYLGKNNSQHEEELSKYFSNNNNDSSDIDNSSKISQLRQLLEQNSLDNKANLTDILYNGTEEDRTVVKHGSPFIYTVPQHIVPNIPIVTTNARRRVSFETPVPDETVPPSPNTRRKNFSFTPISPGPQSPNGRQSKCSSSNVSPFVSPRNTPVPRCKNNIHQNAGIMVQQSQPRKCIATSGMKIKKEPESILELPRVKERKNYLTISAPTSPRTCNKSVLQKLLNASGKVSYTPNYGNQHVPKHEASNEISQIFPNEIIPALSDVASYRSQSVPLHQMVSGKQNFMLSNDFLTPLSVQTTTNDFNDLDPIADNETVRVNNIINSLDDQPCENNNIDLFNVNMTANSLSEYGLMTRNNLDQEIDFSQNNMTTYEQPIPANRAPSLRNLNRSQSIEVGSFEQKCIPSRSVPSTPISQGNKLQFVKFVNPNSRSYPSTPVSNNEGFSYNINRDWLLNGQPIKTDSLTERYEPLINFDEMNGDTNMQEHLIQDDGKVFIDSQLPETEFIIVGNPDDIITISAQDFNVSSN